MIESGIAQLLLADVGFSTIAADRLTPVLLPPASPLPAATYQVVSKMPDYTLDGNVNVTSMRLQIDTWGSTYSDAKSLAGAVKDALDDYTGVLPEGTTVFGIQIHNETDLYESAAMIYRVMLEFSIQYGVTA